MRKPFLKAAAMILAVSVLLSGCVIGEQTETTEPSDEPSDTVFLKLGVEDANTNAKTVTVVVENESINTVLAGIFGANVSWRGDGYGQWDSEHDCPDGMLLQQLIESGVTHLRYPGGIEGDYFHWNESIGEDRLPQIDPFSADYPTYDAYNGEMYIATFGPDEFLELCQAAGDGVTIQLNAGNGTAEEAADWVRYYLEKNADVWSFCVGNEVCMAEERVSGMTVTCTPQEYVDFYNAVYEALGDTADEIELGCIGINPYHPLCKYRNWDSTVLTQLADKIDFIDVHIGYSPYFTSGETEKDIVKCLMASSDWIKMMLDEEVRLINECAGEYADDITIQITEWGPIGGYSTSVAGSVFMASFLNTVIAEPKVSSACYLPLINHYSAANLLGSLVDTSVIGKTVYWDNTNTYVFRWYSEQVGRDVLKTSLSGADTFDSVAVGLVPAQSDVSVADSSVYYDAATGKGTIFLINRSYDENVKFSLELPFENVTVDIITEMWNESSVAGNSYANPKMVTPNTYEAGQSVTDGHLEVETKPISVLRIDFTVNN